MFLVRCSSALDPLCQSLSSHPRFCHASRPSSHSIFCSSNRTSLRPSVRSLLSIVLLHALTGVCLPLSLLWALTSQVALVVGRPFFPCLFSRLGFVNSFAHFSPPTQHPREAHLFRSSFVRPTSSLVLSPRPSTPIIPFLYSVFLFFLPVTAFCQDHRPGPPAFSFLQQDLTLPCSTAKLAYPRH